MKLNGYYDKDFIIIYSKNDLKKLRQNLVDEMVWNKWNKKVGNVQIGENC